ncbi:MAG: helix-turn-helix domain-containing protein [Chloroflexota bacterium]
MPSSARQRFGVMIRDARRARDWTQDDVGKRANVPQSVVAAVESGAGARIDTLERICDALSAELVLEARLPFVGDPAPQSDRGHARCVGSVRRLLEAAGYVCATEQEVLDAPWRGWIDLVGYNPMLRGLVIVEVKTELHDAGALERQVDRYVRLSLGVARRHGWSVGEIVVVALVLATTANDAFLIANRQVLGASFPIRGRSAVSCALDGDPVRGRMLLMLDPRRRGRRSLLRSAADGRRTEAPYRDYRAFVAALDPPRVGATGRVGAAARGGSRVGSE